MIELDNGGALDLTVGEYLTRDGDSVDKVGIEPDVPARDRPATKPDEGLQGALGRSAPRLTARTSAVTPRRPTGGKQQVVVVSKRGRFLVGEPVFEREGRVALGGGAKVGARADGAGRVRRRARPGWSRSSATPSAPPT